VKIAGAIFSNNTADNGAGLALHEIGALDV